MRSEWCGILSSETCYQHDVILGVMEIEEGRPCQIHEKWVALCLVLRIRRSLVEGSWFVMSSISSFCSFRERMRKIIIITDAL